MKEDLDTDLNQIREALSGLQSHLDRMEADKDSNLDAKP